MGGRVGGNGSGVEFVIGASLGIYSCFCSFPGIVTMSGRSNCRRRSESAGWVERSRVLSLKGSCPGEEMKEGK